jgi:hypothetical protein
VTPLDAMEVINVADRVSMLIKEVKRAYPLARRVRLP